MSLKNIKIVFLAFVALFLADAAAYAVPADFTLGDIKFEGLRAKGTYSCLPKILLNSNGDFSDLKVRLLVNAILAPSTLSSLKVEVDKYRMPFTAAFDGNNTVVLDILNLLPGSTHITTIGGLQFDPTSLTSNFPVTGSIGISGTGINPTNLTAFFGITQQSGGEGSAVLSGDFTQAISPRTYWNNKFYDVSYSFDSKLNFKLSSALEYKFTGGGRTSNFIWQANDGYRLTFADLSFGLNSYYLTSKYDPTAGLFVPQNYGPAVPATDSNASNFAAATSVVGHELNQLTGFYSMVSDVVKQYTSDQSLSCPQGGTWGIKFYSPTSIQNTFTGCQGLSQGVTVDGGLWLWTNNNTWSTDNVRRRGPSVGGSYDITYKNIFAVGVQMGNTYSGTISGTSTGFILNGSNRISADHTFANVNFNTVSGPTATTLNVLSGGIYSGCVNGWFTPVVSNWQNDSQGPISGTFYINSMNGGKIIGTAFSAGGASTVTSGVNVVETHPNSADLEAVCSASSTSPTPTSVIIQSLSFTVNALPTSSVINVTGSISTTGNASGATIHLTLTGGQTAAVTTDVNGNFSTSFTVYSTGDYTVTVVGVDPPSGEVYDPSHNIISSYTAFVN